MPEDDDLKRYIEYFQKQLISPENEGLIDIEREWFSENREQIRLDLAKKSNESKNKSENAFKRLELSLADFEPDFAYDSFFARTIFLPLIDELSQIMKESGFSLKADVIFANSPAIEANAAGIPSINGHILFAGRGTFAFCNYWGKVFIEITDALEEGRSIEESMYITQQDVFVALESKSVGKKALALSLYYAITETLIGFGRVDHPEETNLARGLLVNAMEAFIIGHELHHFAAIEQYPETDGIKVNESLRDLEIACDSFGLAISSVYGAKNHNQFAFLGIGALVLFWTLKICYESRAYVVGVSEISSGTHPSFDERILSVSEFAVAVSDKKNLKAFLQSIEKVNVIGSSLYSFVLKQIKGI